MRSDITRDPVKEKKLEMLTRMPQLTSIIRSYLSLFVYVCYSSTECMDICSVKEMVCVFS